MPKKKRRRSIKTGLPPGTMVYVGDKSETMVKIEVIDYDQQNYEAHPLEKIEEILEYKKKPTTSWINITGLHNVDFLQSIGNHFSIHSLILEDILNTDQRPKIEIHDKHIFVVLKMITFDKAKQKLEHEQISLIMGKGYVLSFQEFAGDIFDPLRERIKNRRGRIRSMGADYLLYALMDIIVDHYFVVLEDLGEELENLEEQVLAHPDRSVMQQIHRLKNELIHLRRTIWPLREVINNLIRQETPLIDPSTELYLKDLYDHTIQIVDSVETYRDMVSGLLDVYLSSVSNRMNEVMKVLTMIATIFIPLSFLAGIYGMNFEYMPELQWRWGYFAVLGIFAFVAAGMLIFFRKKGWI